MSDHDVNAAIKQAAESLGAALPGHHVVVLVRAPSGHVGAYANSPDINTHPDLVGELQRAVYYIIAANVTRDAAALASRTADSGGKPADRDDRDPPTPGQQPHRRLPASDDS